MVCGVTKVTSLLGEDQIEKQIFIAEKVNGNVPIRREVTKVSF